MSIFYQIVYNQITNDSTILPRRFDKHNSVQIFENMKSSSYIRLVCFVIDSIYVRRTSMYIPLSIYSKLRKENIYAHILPNLERTQQIAFKFAYYKSVTDNKHILPNSSDLFKSVFEDAQRKYHLLNRLVYRYKCRKMPIHISTDLYLNPIQESDHNTFCLIHGATKYLFTVPDILRIIHDAITNSSFLDTSIKIIKNPYTNIPFTKTDLYNIYFYVASHYIRVPELLHQLFIHDFSVKQFQLQNEQFLQNIYFDNLTTNCSQTYLVYQIKRMLSSVKYYTNIGKKIVIDKDFPNDDLVRIMMPYLKLYLKYLFHYNNYVKTNCLTELTRRLKTFYAFNPLFGRKFIKITSRYKKGTAGTNNSVAGATATAGADKNIEEPEGPQNTKRYFKQIVDFNMRHPPFRNHRNSAYDIPFQVSHLINTVNYYDEFNLGFMMDFANINLVFTFRDTTNPIQTREDNDSSSDDGDDTS